MIGQIFMSQQKVNIFFIIGAQRSGTTYLYQILDEHPSILMARPIRPEPKFFINPALQDKDNLFYLNNFFRQRSSNHILGEKSTSYIEYPSLGEKILSRFPEAKIIVILRNPVQRAISNYFFSKKNKIETRSLEEVFIENKRVSDEMMKKTEHISVSPFDYLKRSKYIQYLKPYFEAFDKNNRKVLIFEKLLEDKVRYIQELYHFLGVNENFIPSKMQEKINTNNISYNIPLVVSQKLQDYFSPFNKDLSLLLEEDLSIWEK